MKDEKNNEGKKTIKVKVPEAIEAGVYTNAISVHFNQNECIIDMGYSIPNKQDPIIKVVSRVNMSHSSAESFLKVLSNSVLDWKNRKKENNENNEE